MKPPLILVHGTCAQPVHWEPWLGYFRQSGYEAVAPALPGRAPVDLNVLSRATFDDCVAVVREAHGRCDRPPVLIGYSMGGLIAQRVAATAECAGLVLIGSATPFPMRLQWHLVGYALPLLFRVLAGQPFRLADDTVRELVLHHLSVAEQDEVLRDMVPESGRAFRRVALALVRVRASDIRCPVLCVTGADDRVVAPRATAELARRYGGDLLTIPNCGHWPCAGSLLESVAAPVKEWIRVHA